LLVSYTLLSISHQPALHIASATALLVGIVASVLHKVVTIVFALSFISFQVVQSNNTTQLFVLLAGHTTSPLPPPHQVLLIIGFKGSVLSIVILVQAITSFNVFTSAQASILSSFVFNTSVKSFSDSSFPLTLSTFQSKRVLVCV
jgi:hypothetical protein